MGKTVSMDCTEFKLNNNVDHDLAVYGNALLVAKAKKDLEKMDYFSAYRTLNKIKLFENCETDGINIVSPKDYPVLFYKKYLASRKTECLTCNKEFKAKLFESGIFYVIRIYCQTCRSKKFGNPLNYLFVKIIGRIPKPKPSLLKQSDKVKQ